MTFDVPPPARLRAGALGLPTPPQGGSDEGRALEGCFGTDGIEIDEPRLEQGPGHLLQRLVHPPVQFDFVVQACRGRGRWRVVRSCPLGPPLQSSLGRVIVTRHLHSAEFDLSPSYSPRSKASQIPLTSEIISKETCCRIQVLPANVPDKTRIQQAGDSSNPTDHAHQNASDASFQLPRATNNVTIIQSIRTLTDFIKILAE